MFGKRKSFNQPETKPSESASSYKPVSHDLLVQAAGYVSFVSGGGKPNVILTGLREPTACKSSTSEGVSFLFDSKDGVSGKFYFFPKFASIWPDGEVSPRPQIPTEMIGNQVVGYADALRQLFMAVPRAPDLSALTALIQRRTAH